MVQPAEDTPPPESAVASLADASGARGPSDPVVVPPVEPAKLPPTRKGGPDKPLRTGPGELNRVPTNRATRRRQGAKAAPVLPSPGSQEPKRGRNRKGGTPGGSR